MIEHVDADTYRANVQRVQAEAMDWTFEHRVRPGWTGGTPSHSQRWRFADQTPPVRPRIHVAYFEVFYDGWQTIGYEIDPMTPETRRKWDEEAWTKLVAQAAADLAS